MLTNKMIKKFPEFIVITKRTIYHEGDERSKRYPGHGYGEHSEIVDVVTEYFDECELRADLLTRDPEKLVIYKVSPVTVSKKVSIDINS